MEIRRSFFFVFRVFKNVVLETTSEAFQICRKARFSRRGAETQRKPIIYPASPENLKTL